MDTRGKTKARKEAQELLEHELSAIVDVDEEINRLYAGVITPRDKGVLTYRALIMRQLVRKASCGESKALQDIVDRILGKTVQVNENLNVNATYSDFLSDLADLEDQNTLPTIEAPYTMSIDNPSDVLHPELTAPTTPANPPPTVTIRPATRPATPKSDLFD